MALLRGYPFAPHPETAPMTQPPTPRRDLRFEFTAQVLAVDPASGERREGTVENISHGGCFVRTREPFHVWARLRLWIVYRGQQFEAEVSVTHSRGGHGMGIQFEKITPDNMEMLEHWLQELRH
jgi:hypothetical protein